MMEFNSLFNIFKGKSNKLITFILIGVLLLIIVMPVKNKSSYESGSVTEVKNNHYDTDAEYSYAASDAYISNAAYFEDKLKSTLEKSYGEGTMDVMVSLKEAGEKNSYYESGANEGELVVDGVLIVADVRSSEEAADIAFAVCSLFNLPAHKVAVLIKK